MTDEEIKEYWRTAYCNEKYKKEELEKENEELKDDVRTWKGASSENSYRAFQLQEENKILSKHIVELQKDKGDLIDENKRLKNEIEDLRGYCNQMKKIKTEIIKLFEKI